MRAGEGAKRAIPARQGSRVAGCGVVDGVPAPAFAAPSHPRRCAPLEALEAEVWDRGLRIRNVGGLLLSRNGGDPASSFSKGVKASPSFAGKTDAHQDRNPCKAYHEDDDDDGGGFVTHRHLGGQVESSSCSGWLKVPRKPRMRVPRRAKSESQVCHGSQAWVDGRTSVRSFCAPCDPS